MRVRAHTSGTVEASSPPGTAPALPILTFHALEQGSSLIAFPPEAFRRGLTTLRKHGYRSALLRDVAALLREGQALPARTVVITFDDGYRSVYEHGLPALREHGMSATLFITTGKRGSAGRLSSLEGRQMLSWAEVREMRDSGCEIGAHTLTHPDLTKLAPEQVAEEMRGSKELIEKALGSRVESFAYPFGFFDAESRRLARSLFTSACSDRLGLVRAASDLHALERVETYYLRAGRLFDLVPTAWLARYLRLRNLPRRMRRAIASRA